MSRNLVVKEEKVKCECVSSGENSDSLKKNLIKLTVEN